MLRHLPAGFGGEIRTDSYSRMFYSTDASIYQVKPLAVALPRSRDDVQMLVEACAREHIPLLPRGSGSSLAGQAVGQAVVVDFSRYLNRIVEINSEEHWARVQPGVVCDDLKRAARPHGLQYGCDPASANRATLGGMLSNNSTGAHSILYGISADHVLETDVILSDASSAHFASRPHSTPIPAGHSLEDQVYRRVVDIVAENVDAIRECYPRTWRNSSGYRLNYLVPPAGYSATRPERWIASEPYPQVQGLNLAKLLAGSEGTLAVVTELKVNLVPLPRKTMLGILQFDRIAAACDAAPAILETDPSAVELVDQMMLRLTRLMPAYERMLTFVEGDPAAVLIVEYYGDSEAELLAALDRLEARMRSSDTPARPIAMTRAVSEREQANVWGIRKVALGLLMSVRGDAKPIPFIEDVAVPVRLLGDYVRELERLFAAHNVRAGYYAHASAGCLHIRPLIDTKLQNQIDTMRAIAEEVVGIVKRMEGAMSGEHGDGLVRSCWNERLFGSEVYRAFRQVKQTFDPNGILNPGKVVDAADMTDSLRYGATYRAIELQTHLDFSREGGFIRAVEQCNGAGVCRKSDGVMCPSFQATREEEHSTRGRANALRAALSGALPPAQLTSKRMHAVLDLCVECKACKAECPSAVDMAKIKYEFLAQYQAVHGVPLRSRFFANIHGLSRLAHRFAPLLNPALRLPLVRRLNQKVLGIAPERVLPPFAAQSFRAWFERRQKGARLAGPSPDRPVVLFVDTFTNFNHPEIGQAAVRLLEAAGHRVVLADHGCCGRPMISKGLLSQARAAAQRNVATLAPFVEQAIPIVGLEPSCLLTLRDEYLDLLPDDPRARQVAGGAVMLEEFLAGQADRGELKLNWKPEPRRVLVHGHCYQKALVGTVPLLQMLRLPGWEVSEINSGCCGMAGSFGYEAEHYKVSQAMGEDRLFPAVRSAGADTLVAAAGMSCRHQIAHGAGRTPQHPVVLLAGALLEAGPSANVSRGASDA
jgi:FAD/FMN-containing dehydrogenase/Fe-S oxidoreductase